MVSEIGSTNILRLLINHNPSFYKLFSRITQSSNNKKGLQPKQSLAQYKGRLNSFVMMASSLFSQTITNDITNAIPTIGQDNLTKKRTHYQKIVFSTRFRKIMLPSSFKYIVGAEKQKKIGHHFFKRTKLLRFYFKKYKKSIQKKKIIRLKDVHFFIPPYLQIDFRTLRVIKVQSPSSDEIYYPFRISLPKRYSFYRSKGF